MVVQGLKYLMKGLVGVAIFAALSSQVWAKADSPATVAGATTIDTQKAKQLFVQGIKFIDVRSNSDWEAGRIPLATHIELHHQFTPENLAQVIAKDEPVVFYCNSLKCHRSAHASKKAVSWGYTKVYYYRTGYPAWRNALNPVE